MSNSDRIVSVTAKVSGQVSRLLDQVDLDRCETVVGLEEQLIIVYTNKMLQWWMVAAVDLWGGYLIRPVGQFIFHAAQRQHAKIRRNLLKFGERISDSLAFTGRRE